MADPTNIEELQRLRYGDPQQATTEALVQAVLLAFTPSASSMSYVDTLRALQGALTAVCADGGQDMTPAQHDAVLQALGQLDPRADDRTVEAATVVLRLRTALDRELSRWTSATVQPPGPSGTTAVATPQQTAEAPDDPPTH